MFQELCLLEPNNEWSGIVVYKVLGSLERMESIEIIPEHIKLMDIGTATYTEYDFTPYMLDVFDEFPDLLDPDKGYRMGHIHSHNKMNVFFSSTDLFEIQNNCENHHIYFSMIVNNKSHIDARIAIAAQVKTVSSSISTWDLTNLDGEVINFKSDNKKEVIEDVCLTYKPLINLPKVSKSPSFSTFQKDMKAIIENKKRILEDKVKNTPVKDQPSEFSFKPKESDIKNSFIRSLNKGAYDIESDSYSLDIAKVFSKIDKKYSNMNSSAKSLYLNRILTCLYLGVERNVYFTQNQGLGFSIFVSYVRDNFKNQGLINDLLESVGMI